MSSPFMRHNSPCTKSDTYWNDRVSGEEADGQERKEETEEEEEDEEG